MYLVSEDSRGVKLLWDELHLKSYPTDGVVLASAGMSCVCYFSAVLASCHALRKNVADEPEISARPSKVPMHPKLRIIREVIFQLRAVCSEESFISESSFQNEV